jgi:molecular chaperone DnaK (HSP70)
VCRLDPLALQRVSAAAEATKIRLSDAEVATVDLPFLDGVLGIRTDVSLSQFEALTAGLRVRLWNALDAVGQEAGLTWADRYGRNL